MRSFGHGGLLSKERRERDSRYVGRNGPNDWLISIQASNPTSRGLPRLLLAVCISLSSVFVAAEPLHGHAQASTFQKSDDKKQNDKDQSVRLHSDLVVVNVTVTDQEGRFIHSLKAGDFILQEDNARQSIHTLEADEASFAAAILVDMSGSMEYKFGMVRGSAAAFIEHIGEDDQVAVYGFNDKIKQFQDFSNNRYITDYIWDAKAEDDTRLYDCIDTGINALLTRPEKRRAVLLISDGWDNTSQKASMSSVMKKALSAGIVIYCVDIIEDEYLAGGGSAAPMLRRGRAEMQEFARQTGGRYIHSPHGDKLDERFTGLVDELRNQYTLTYYPANEKRDGRWRALSVGVSRPGAVTRARRGYYAPKSP